MILLADSGGTKTDWVLLSGSEIVKNWTTESYHPAQFSNDFWERQVLFWQNQDLDFSKISLHFFGAGCGNPLAVDSINDFARHMQFQTISVSTDTEAACLASFGRNNDGFVIISGTGSVLVHWQTGQIVSMHGGNGYLLGDEGSGFFAGKMILNAYLNGQFTTETQAKLVGLLGDRKQLLQQVYGENGKQFISGISAILPGNTEIEFIHRKNIELFVSTFSKQFAARKSDFYIVGSYGFAKREIWVELLNKYSTSLHFVKEPIKNLTQYFVNLNR